MADVVSLDDGDRDIGALLNHLLVVPFSSRKGLFSKSNCCFTAGYRVDLSGEFGILLDVLLLQLLDFCVCRGKSDLAITPCVSLAVGLFLQLGDFAVIETALGFVLATLFSGSLLLRSCILLQERNLSFKLRDSAT